MNNIYKKIWDEEILDSEIIQEMESAKKIPGFDINLTHDDNGWSLLTAAVWQDRKELVEYLLSNPNININHKDLYACDQGSILKLLLNHKDLDVNIQNSWGRTGLYWVCRWGHKACVREYLLDARVNTSICDILGGTAWGIALKYGYLGIAKIINNSRYTTLLRIPNNLLLYDVVRMIIEEYV